MLFNCNQENKLDSNLVKPKDLVPPSTNKKDLANKIKTDKELKNKQSKTKNPIIKKGQIYLNDKKPYNYFFYPNEFVGLKSKRKGKVYDTIHNVPLMKFTHACFKNYGVPSPHPGWLDTYYVPFDSLESWLNKNIILGQYIHIDEEYIGALLYPLIIIHFSEKPSDNEFDEIKTKFNLSPVNSKHIALNESKKGKGYWAFAKLDDIKADKIIMTCTKISNYKTVDWVQNQIYTGEPNSYD